MADLEEYKSEYTGEQVDRAVEKTLAALRTITIQGVTSERITVPYGAITGTLSDQADLQLAFNAKQDTLTAGAGIVINDNVISSTASAPTWGSIEGVLSAQTDLQSALDAKQGTLTAGNNVQISSTNEISATDTTYTAGANIQISSTNEISATDTVYTAGTGISVANNVISFINGHALKSYLDEGELLTDAEGLADVEYYNRSMFDSSKFTVVGSPTITDDGIASGFSSSSYLDSQQSVVFIGGQTWKIKTKVNVKSYSNAGVLFQIFDGVDTNNSLQSELHPSGGIYWTCPTVPSSAATNRFLEFTSSFSFASYLNQDVYLSWEYDGNNYILGWSLDGVNYTYENALTTSHTFTGTGIVRFGWRYSYTTGLDSSIDLKQFSITVDGKEVFNGNKSGIDQIKANDYTVVGSPTISDDGVVSGFSASNYLTLPNLQTNNPFKIKYKFKLNARDKIQVLIGVPTTGFLMLRVTAENKLQLGLSTEAGGWDIGLAAGNSVLSSNVNYYIELIYTGAKYTLNLSTDGKSYTEEISLTSSTKINKGNSVQLYLGVYRSDKQDPLDGSIDLNSFKIYVDNQLVYQPTLRIPYNHTKTGSKIAHSYYRDRIEDMAEQFGWANYYTLSDTNFTVPQGENLDGHVAVVDWYKNGITSWEYDTNLDCIETGSCTSGTAVTLPKAFADTNYSLSVPYSAKTKTGFTPSASGEYIARGKVVLG